MNIFCIRFSLLLGFLLSLFPINACGDYFSEDNEFMLFRRALTGNKSFLPFYYTSVQDFNSNRSDAGDAEGLQNVKEWEKFVNDKSVRWMDIYNANYNLDADEFIQNSRFPSYRKKLKSTFVDWLYRKENKAVLEYFMLAKQVESKQYLQEDSWSPFTPDLKTLHELIEVARLGVEKNSGFLKERYLFQWIKIMHYTGGSNDQFQAMQKAFDDQLKDKHSVIANWAYYYIATQQPTEEEKVKYLLEAFYRTQEKRFVIVMDWYRTIMNFDVSKLSSGHLKEAYWAIKGLRKYNQALEIIKEVYAINPNSEFLAPLMEREVNKVENYLWSKQLLGHENLNDDLDFIYYYWNDEINRQHTHSTWYLRNLISTFSQFDISNTKNRIVQKLALSHLHLLNNDPHSSYHVLEQLSPQKGTKLHEQYVMEKILCFGQLKDITQPAVKQELADLIRAYKELGNEQVGWDDNRWGYDQNFMEEVDDLDELYIYLSHCYELRGDKLTAGLLAQKAKISRATHGYYIRWIEQRAEYRNEDYEFDPINVYPNIVYFDYKASVEEVEELIAFKHKKDKTEFETLISPNVWCSDDFYKDLMVTKYVRKNELHKAYAIAKTIKDDFWEKAYEFKSYLPKTDIRQLKDVKWEKYPKAKQISKALPLQTLVELLDKVQNKDKYTADQLAKLYLELGNAYYNMGYFGQFWMLTGYGWSGSEYYEGKIDEPPYGFYSANHEAKNQYYFNSIGLEYYNKALAIVKDQELKALITLNKHSAAITKESRVSKSDWEALKSTKVFGYAKTLCPDIRW